MTWADASIDTSAEGTAEEILAALEITHLETLGRFMGIRDDHLVIAIDRWRPTKGKTQYRGAQQIPLEQVKSIEVWRE